MSDPCPHDWELCHRGYCRREHKCADKEASAPFVKRAALSAEPAQEMTDEQILAHFQEDADDGTDASAIRIGRALIAADRASRLPEMSEGDWPDHMNLASLMSIPQAHRESARRYAQGYAVAAVEAYKALCRGKT